MNTYKRINDYIDKDALINKAVSSIDFYLSTTNLNSEDKRQVKNELRNLIEGISDGTLIYRQDTGFDNKSNRNLINNSDPKKDYLGFAAYFLGDIIRNSSPIEQDSNSIGKYLLKNIFGSDEDYDIEPFKNLDYENPLNTTKRSEYIMQLLDNVAENYNDINPNFDEKTKLEWMKRYNKIKQAGIINKGNLLDLAWVTQIPNISDWFTTEEIQKEIPEVEQPSETPAVETPAVEEPTKVTNVKVPTKKPKFNDIAIDLKTNNSYDLAYFKKYESFVKRLPDETLFTLINLALSKNNFEISKTPGFPRSSKLITNKDALNIITRTLYKRGSLNKYYGNNNQYYLNGTKNNNIGYVYEPSTHRIIARDISNIPYFVTAKKQGGILKAESGLSFPQLDAVKYTQQKLGVNTSPFGLTSDLSTEVPTYPSGGYDNILDAVTWDDTFSQYYQDNGKWKLKTRVAGAENTANDIYYKPENLEGTTSGYTPGKFDSVVNLENSPQYQGALKLFMENDELAIRKLNDYIAKRGETSDTQLKQYYNKDTNKWDLEGARKVLKRLMMDNKLGIAHDILLGSTYYIDGQPNVFYKSIPKGYSAVEGEEWTNDGLIRKIKLIKDSDDSKKTDDTGSISGKKDHRITEETPDQKKTSIKMPWKDQLATDFLMATKLPLALDTNERVARLLSGNIPVSLKNTYELYSPVTGAYNYMQMLNNQGASRFSMANRGNVSDYRLNAQSQYQAALANNALQEKGNLANDAEKKRTAAEALTRTEGNIARRSALFNNNMDTIQNRNYTAAQIEAQKKQRNYNSLSNTIDWYANKFNNRYEENKAIYESMYENNLNKYIADWKAAAMKPATDAYKAWNRTKNGQGLLSDWEYGTQYNNWKNYVDRMAYLLRQKEIASLNGIKYNSPIDDEGFNNFLKMDWKNPVEIQGV